MTQLSIDQLVTRVLDLADRKAPLARASDEFERTFDDHLSAVRPAEANPNSVDRPRRNETRPHSAESAGERRSSDESDAAYEPVANEPQLAERVEREEVGKLDAQHVEKDATTEAVVAGEVSAKLPQDNREVKTAVDDAETVELVDGQELTETTHKNTADNSTEVTRDATTNSPQEPQAARHASAEKLATTGQDSVEIKATENGESVEEPSSVLKQETVPPETQESVSQDKLPLPEGSEEVLEDATANKIDRQGETNEQHEAASAATTATGESSTKAAKVTSVEPPKAADHKTTTGQEVAEDTEQPAPATEPKQKVDRRHLNGQPADKQVSATASATRQQSLTLEPTSGDTATTKIDTATVKADATGAELRTDAPQSSAAPTPAAPQFVSANQITPSLRPDLTKATKPRQPITEAQQSRFLNRVAGAFQSAQRGDGEVRIRLHPPELGALRMQIKVEDGVLIARLETETHNARQLLLDNLPVLRERLATQEIRIERFDVDVRDESSQHGQQQSAGEQTDTRQQRNAHSRSPQLERSNDPAVDEKILAQPIVGDAGLNVVI